LGQEFQKIYNAYGRLEYPAYRGFVQGEPALNLANQLTMANVAQQPALERQLTSAFGAIPPTGQYQAAIQSAYGQQVPMPQLTNVLRNAYQSATPTGQLTNIIRNAAGQAVPERQLTSPLMATYRNYLTPILQTGGALTPQLTRQATQEAAARNAAAGMATTMPGLFGEALNRDVYRQQRYGTALNQALGLTGQVSSLDTAALQRGIAESQAISGLDTAGLQRAMGYTGALSGLGTQNLGNAVSYANAMRGMDLGNFQQTLGYLNALQGLRQGPIENLLGIERAGTSNFAQLLNPTQQYAQDVFNTNYNAAAASNIANANKQAGLGGAAIGTTGQVASKIPWDQIISGAGAAA
jgi:hypothetical protein